MSDQRLEPLEIPEGAGGFLRTLLGPHSAEPSSGPPYTHVHKLPEDEEGQEYEPWVPFTVEHDRP